MTDWINRRGIHKDWEVTPLSPDNAGEVLRQFFAPDDWGDPVSAAIWEKETWTSEYECDSETKVIAGLYSNGKVHDVRLRSGRFSASTYTARNTSHD